MTRTTKESFGPYVDHPPVAAFNSISQRCFEEYHRLLDGLDHDARDARQHLVVRMMYIAESTSYAVRLTASWAASLPAMSLCRDRYEQAVRFSYLANQSDDEEWNKFAVDFFQKRNALGRRMAGTQSAKDAFERLAGPMEDWMTEAVSEDDKRFLTRWKRASLESLASKRDKAVRKSELLPDLAREPLAPLYVSMYVQPSSVTHYDLHAVSMLGLHEKPDGGLVLAPDPWWPAFLGLHCALFDIVQVYDCMRGFFGLDERDGLAALHAEWRNCCTKMGTGGAAATESPS